MRGGAVAHFVVPPILAREDQAIGSLDHELIELGEPPIAPAAPIRR